MRSGRSLLPRVAVLMAAILPTSAGAAVPPTLTGEELAACNQIQIGGSATPCASGSDVGSVTITSINSALGQGGTVSFTASGQAAGPYGGTFTESGTGTWDGPTGAPLLDWESTFDIDSPTGTVHGTKRLQTRVPAEDNNCRPLGMFAGVQNLSYEATITTASGVFIDRGSSLVGLEASTASTDFFFSEVYTSSLTAPEPAAAGLVADLLNKTLSFLGETQAAAGLRALLQQAASAITSNNTRGACGALAGYVRAVQRLPAGT
jgi:hypothetical protein